MLSSWTWNLVSWHDRSPPLVSDVSDVHDKLGWSSWQQAVTGCQWQLSNFESLPLPPNCVLNIHSHLVFANICDKSFAFFLRLPSSWHVTFVKKYGMERKQKLDWLSCDTEGRDWLRLRTPEGGREFAAPGPGQQPGSSNPPHTTAAGVTTFSRTGEQQEAGEVNTVRSDVK